MATEPLISHESAEPAERAETCRLRGVASSAGRPTPSATAWPDADRDRHANGHTALFTLAITPATAAQTVRPATDIQTDAWTVPCTHSSGFIAD